MSNGFSLTKTIRDIFNAQGKIQSAVTAIAEEMLLLSGEDALREASLMDALRTLAGGEKELTAVLEKLGINLAENDPFANLRKPWQRAKAKLGAVPPTPERTPDAAKTDALARLARAAKFGREAGLSQAEILAAVSGKLAAKAA